MNSSFAQLYADVCAIAGEEASEAITLNDEGTQLVQFRMGGIDVDLLQEDGGTSRIFTRVAIGEIEGNAAGVKWRDLLGANFNLLGIGGPVFCREPWSGKVVAQQAWTSDTRPQLLVAAMSSLCGLAHDWQDGRLDFQALSQELSACDAQTSEDEAGRLRAPLAELCEQLRTMPGLQALALHTLPSGGAFIHLSVQGVVFQVCQIGTRADHLQVFAELASMRDEALFDLHMAEANASLLIDIHSPVFCRRPVTHEAVLGSHFAVRPHAPAAALLSYLHALANATHSMRLGLSSTAS